MFYLLFSCAFPDLVDACQCNHHCGDTVHDDWICRTEIFQHKHLTQMTKLHQMTAHALFSMVMSAERHELQELNIAKLCT